MRTSKMKVFVAGIVLVGFVAIGLVVANGSKNNGTGPQTSNTISFAEGPGASPN